MPPSRPCSGQPGLRAHRNSRWGAIFAKHPSDGEPCVITGSVASLDGTRLAGAVLDFWEASSDGFYDLQSPNGPNLWTRLRTDAQATS